ncbi:hypothetical protein LSAT2_027694, partial [Lamellibrachia satsuma]
RMRRQATIWTTDPAPRKSATEHVDHRTPRRCADGGRDETTVPSTTRRRLAVHTDSNDRPMNFDTGPNQIRDGPSVKPGQVTRKRLKRRKRERSLSSSDGYDPPREDRQPNPRLTRRATDRSLRPRTRSVTAREAADRFDSDSESLSTTKYFRKRRNLA